MTRRFELGLRDVENYCNRFYCECGEVVERKATPEELEAIKKRISKKINIKKRGK